MSEFEFCSKEDVKFYCDQERERISSTIKDYIRKGHPRPRFLIVQVGDNPASNKYVKMKIEDCNLIGIEATHMKFPETITYNELVEFLLKERDFYHSIIIQKPTNTEIDSQFDSVIEYIRPHQDVDGFRKDSFFKPATSLGIYNYLKYGEENNKLNKKLSGSHCVLVGRGELVCRPLIELMLSVDCTVTVCHSKTKKMWKHTNQADIIVSGVGKANLIDSKYVKPNAIVIDAGVDFVDGKVCGDCYLDDVLNITPYCSRPVGGVGVLTRTTLLSNILESYEMQEIDV